MNHYLRQYLDQGYTIVTSSQRQAHNLKMAYANAMVEEGKAVWRTPEILTWSVWIKKSWEAGTQDDNQVLLGTSQQRLVWQSIIESSSYTQEILQTDTIVDTAIQAYDLCHEWKIDLFPKETFLNGDARAFQSWIESYQKKLADSHWLDSSSLPDELMQNNFKPETPGIVLYGFDLLTNRQRSFLDYLKEKQCEVIEFQPEARNKSASYFGFADHQAELKAAANWARHILTEQPDATIGIVVPDLHSRRETVSAVFDAVLHPDWMLKQPGTFQRLYSIAPGRPLAGYPMIHAAMEVLSLGYERIPVRRLEFLLRSSFIKGAEKEAGKRARFYAELREIGEPAWRMNTLLEYIELHRQYIPVANEFIALLSTYSESLKKLPATQSPREWSETFNMLLKRVGWPGERSLNSIEYQTLKEWRKALLDLAGLGAVKTRWNYAEALSALKDVLEAASFQPETVETPIQISGLPGIAGMAFDYVRITGMHDLIWPGPAIANPFIPLALQKQAGVPGSSAEQVIDQCRKETDALIQSARHIVFSYAKQEGDREYRPSPILKKYLSVEPEVLPRAPSDFSRQVFESRDLESYTDISAPAFSKVEKASGGSGILSDQSACPFRAFAHHRLNATALSDIDIGLDPAIRGLLVHEVMHDVWKRIESQENLKEMAASKLESLVNAMATGAIRKQAKQQPETFTPEFRRLETRRLVSLVMQWLAIEKARPEFTISDLEKRHEVNFNGLNLRMRIDRIDALPDGGLVVIDYKTGDVSIKKWEGDRPEEPQLPLYAVTLDGDVKAVAFAGMKKGRKLGYTGLGSSNDLVDGIAVVSDVDDAWQQQLNQWKTVLGNLADEYLKGHASVTPTDKACRYCDLHSLCRIHEREWLITEDFEYATESTEGTEI